jgi:pyruvate/2-oxoglutarate dehydrogenase complex dihydrolipoamide dehydrogenase (E3) component
MRAEDGTSEAEYQAQLVAMQQEVRQAQKVVIIGGGSVGAEMAGVRRTIHKS